MLVLIRGKDGRRTGGEGTDSAGRDETGVTCEGTAGRGGRVPLITSQPGAWGDHACDLYHRLFPRLSSRLDAGWVAESLFRRGANCHVHAMRAVGVTPRHRAKLAWGRRWPFAVLGKLCSGHLRKFQSIPLGSPDDPRRG